jgi:hypothetical protein
MLPEYDLPEGPPFPIFPIPCNLLPPPAPAQNHCRLGQWWTLAGDASKNGKQPSSPCTSFEAVAALPWPGQLPSLDDDKDHFFRC